MNPRAALLATASAVGLLFARALDGFGLLPGVSESADTRGAAVDPRLTAVGLLGCLLVGAVAERLLVRRAVLAVGALVVGQLTTVMGLEEAGRALTHAPESGDDTGLWVATAVQLVLATLAVATALVALVWTLPSVEQTRFVTAGQRPPLPPYRVVARRRSTGGEWGRAPPCRG